jgi:hypothetical protein
MVEVIVRPEWREDKQNLARSIALAEPVAKCPGGITASASGQAMSRTGLAQPNFDPAVLFPSIFGFIRGDR